MKFILICPEEDFKEICEEADEPSGTRLKFIDPNWSMEQIIGILAGYKAEDVDPF